MCDLNRWLRNIHDRLSHWILLITRILYFDLTVNATCHNTSTSEWTACSESCGIGISTRQIEITAGCKKLSPIRLCQNRRCANNLNSDFEKSAPSYNAIVTHQHRVRVCFYLTCSLISFFWDKTRESALKQASVQIVICPLTNNIILFILCLQKGHECRNMQRIGPSRIRLGPCVSRKLYRPKICGHCQNNNKCCVPLVSTTIQVSFRTLVL